MKLNSRLSCICASVVVSVGVLVIDSGHAGAATLSGCPINMVCAWQNANFSGGVIRFVSGDGDPDFGTSRDTFSNGVLVQDNISSIVNNTSRHYNFYVDANYKGAYDSFNPHTQLAQAVPNDAMSSYKFTS